MTIVVSANRVEHSKNQTIKLNIEGFTDILWWDINTELKLNKMYITTCVKQ